MSATYLTDINYIEIKKAVVLPPDIYGCGTNPLTVVKDINSYPLYMAIELSAGTIAYDFGSGAIFTFQNSVTGNEIFPAAGYTLQVIQGFGICINIPIGIQGFKRNGVFSLPYSLNLTTQDGTDATQGDGILTITYYGLKP
jgi:hypothetical protein